MHGRSKDFIVIAIGRGLQAASTLVTVRVVTGLLGPAQVGRMTLFVSLIALFALLLISPVANYIARQSIEWNLSGQLSKALWRFGLFLVIVSALSAVIVLGFDMFIGVGTSTSRGWLIGFVAINLFFTSLATTLTTVINTIGHRIWFVFLVNMASWLGLAIAIVLVLELGAQAEHWLEGLLVGQFVVALMACGLILALTFRRPQPEITKSSSVSFSFRSVMDFSSPLFLATGFYWMQTNGYRFALAGVADVKTIGLFTVGLSLALAPMAMFDTIFTEYYRPIFYKNIARGDIIQKAISWNMYARIYFPIIILIGALVAAGGPFLARILVSAEFQSVGWLAMWGALIEGAFMVYGTYVSLSFALLNTRVLILPNFLGAVIAIGGTFILAPRDPFWGTGIALFLGMFSTMLITGIRLRRKLPIRIPWQRLGWASLICLPMVIVLVILQSIWRTPSLLQALLVLVFAGLYIVLCFIILMIGKVEHGWASTTSKGGVHD
jgi:O-antigen/teichoic acid export membrane protein